MNWTQTPTGYAIEPLRVLVACERSGVMRRAFQRVWGGGVDAWSCDLEPADDGGTHIQADALYVARNGDWDLVIAHPPCTFQCNSGVRWLHTEPGRWDQMRQGAEFFRAFLELDVPFVAVENPVMHRYSREIVGRGPDFTCQPWQFGDDEKKRTCWWTKNLPPLTPTSLLDGSTAAASIHRAPPGPDRARIRSQTFPGMADAIANQWGAIALMELNEEVTA